MSFSPSASYSTFEAVYPTHPTWRHCAKQNTFLLGQVRIGKATNKTTYLVRKWPGALESYQSYHKNPSKKWLPKYEETGERILSEHFMQTNQQEEVNTGQNGTLVVGRVEEDKFIMTIINDISD